MPPQPGDHVVIRLAAQVTAIDATAITVTLFGGTPVAFPRAIADDPGFKWRQVAAPEPAYQTGELYQDGDGDVFERQETTHFAGDMWRVVRSAEHPLGQYVHHDRPTRPLRRLVAEP